MNAEAQSVPPKIRATPAPGWFAAAVLGAAGAGAGAVVFFFNPSTHGFYPICLFHKLTGWNCPGCGMTRSFYALLHGNFQTAARDNLLLVGLLAASLARGAWFGVKKLLRRPAGQFWPEKILWPLLLIAAIFTVLRNVPAFSFLSP